MSAVGTGSTYTLGQVVQDVVGKNIRLFPILFKQFKHIQYAFFDIKQLAGEGGMTIKPREIPWIDATLTVDGYAVKWLDYSLFDFNTTVTSTNAALAVSSGDITLVVGDTSGFAVNDTVFGIKASSGTSDEFNGVVKSITNATTMVVTLTKVNASTTIPWTIAVLAAQTVERGYWRRNDNDDISRASATFNYKEYKSYVQHFSRQISFTKAELNKVYVYEGDAKMEAQKKFMYNLGILFQEVNKAIYKGSNESPWVGATQKMEMLGLEQVVTECGTRKVITGASVAYSELLAEINIAHQAGNVTSDEPIMLLCNDNFLSELSKINADKVRWDKYVDALKLKVPTLSTVFGEVDIVRDPMLNKLYTTGTAYIVPRSMIKLWVRENQEFNPKGGISRADQSVRIYERITNIRETKSYDMEFELGMIVGGMSLGSRCPVRLVTQFVTPAI